VPSRLSKLVPSLWTMVFLAIAKNPVQAQQQAIHGPLWGYAVAPAKSRDMRQLQLTRTWNPSRNLDSVWLVMGRSHGAPIDSIRYSIKSGPLRLMSQKDPIAATYRSDSLGGWLTVPASLIRPGGGERNVEMPMLVLGVFSPSAITSWARSQNPNRPVVTRVAADVWRRKTYEREELYLEAPAAEQKTTVPPQRKPIPAKPVRK
jgi:hypothetical protein